MSESIEQELISKYNSLSQKRTKLLARKASLENALNEYAKQIDDCFAAARLFGVALTSPPVDSVHSVEGQSGIEKPTLRDFVLSTLENEYPQSLKARQIQDMYELLYGKIHDKTVGMTLYRLSLDKKVVRDGRDWCLLLGSGNQQNLGGEKDVFA